MSEDSLFEFVREAVPDRSELASAVMEHAARSRGLPVDRVDRSTILIGFPAGMAAFVGVSGPDSSFVGKWLVDHAHGLRALLTQHSLPTNEFAVFPTTMAAEALEYAEGIGWPVRVGPNRRIGAHGVPTNVSGVEEFDRAWAKAAASYRKGDSGNARKIKIEELLLGEALRVFVVDGRPVSAIRVTQPDVLGDGVSAIEDLITRKNQQRSARSGWLASAIPILEDQLDALRLSGRGIGDIPADGERVVLCTLAHPAVGGVTIDVTDDLSPKLAGLAAATVRAVPGLSYAEVEIGSREGVGGDDVATTHVVIQVDCTPEPLAHFPEHGAARDISGAIIGHYLTSARWLAAQEMSHRGVG